MGLPVRKLSVRIPMLACIFYLIIFASVQLNKAYADGMEYDFDSNA